MGYPPVRSRHSPFKLSSSKTIPIWEKGLQSRTTHPPSTAACTPVPRPSGLLIHDSRSQINFLRCQNLATFSNRPTLEGNGKGGRDSSEPRKGAQSETEREQSMRSSPRRTTE